MAGTALAVSGGRPGGNETPGRRGKQRWWQRKGCSAEEQIVNGNDGIALQSILPCPPIASYDFKKLATTSTTYTVNRANETNAGM
mmetsp:Transcript_3379/g.9413  ORF Transcript_3379/g.9413 Transcript_3379/m.9413 type:complete len:85 (-) Transcript_3379:943-1197(-)